MLLHRGLWGTSLRECSMMKPTKKTISENSATVIDKFSRVKMSYKKPNSEYVQDHS